MAHIIHDFLCYNNHVERNLSGLLETALDARRLDLIRRVAGESAAFGFSIYLVGGFVRDLLLGHPGLDFDLVFEGDAIALARALAGKYGGKVTAHTKFGTAKIDVREWGIGDSNEGHSIISLDLISSRSETYKHPAALPTVARGSIADDIRRRDFTINALAVRLDGANFGELRDDLGGLADLERGVVRVLHPRSFIDDPTRMFRAVRYEGRYGFRIADETLKLIPEARPLIDKLSPQRLRRELDLILEEPNAASMLRRLDELGLLKAIHPALGKAAERRKKALEFMPPLPHVPPAHLRWMSWLIDLSVDEIKALNRRLHFTAVLLRDLTASSKLLSDLSSFTHLKPSQWVERLDQIPLPAVCAVSLAAPQGKSKQALEKYLEEWRHVKPKTTGHDLKKLGLAPGPKYQKILWRLRAAWLDKDLTSEEQERKFLKTLL
jgi:tRNA nucleotidyltransferase (CCA-adding enzyme)